MYNNKIEDTQIGKISQICLDLKNSNYDNIYYADDCESIRRTTIKIVEAIYPNIKIISIEPTNGIDSLNEELQKYIDDKKSHITK